MHGIGFGLIVVGTLGFQMMRGVGMVSNSPILGDLSEGKDRGEYLSRLQILNQAVSVITGVLIAMLLGGDTVPISRYTPFILTGIVTGIAGSLLLFRLPRHIGSIQKGRESFKAAARRAFADRSFRRFMTVFSLMTCIAGMSRPFIIVYAADIFRMNDSATMYLSVIGSLGALAMGFVAQLLLDRLGAKPILVFFTGTFLLGLVPFLVAPRLAGLNAFLFLGLAFFVFNFGTMGQENSSQPYFYAMVKPEDQLDFGILYFFIFGVGGTLGSLAGGGLIDALLGLGFPPVLSHRIFFGVLFVSTFLLLVSLFRLEALGAFSVSRALNVIFSARDLRAIVLLNRLDRTTTIADERKVIQELGSAPSEVTVDVLVRRLRSPSFTIRTEALRALEGHSVDSRIEKALEAEVKNREYTTAYRAARILGMNQGRRAPPGLRDALKSQDYLLCAESMVALARLKDRPSVNDIEGILRETRNPLLVIYGAEALKLFGDTRSLPVLFSLLERHDLPQDLVDHLVLSIAGILDMEEWFYPYYTLFLEDQHEGIELLLDAVTNARPEGPFRYNEPSFRKAFTGLLCDVELYTRFLSEAFAEADFPKQEVESLRDQFIGILEKATVMDRPNIRFLLAAILTRHLPK